MKKIIWLPVLFAVFNVFLSAQSSASVFSVYASSHVANFNSRDDFENVTDYFAKEQERINYNNAQYVAGTTGTRFIAETRWVGELTRVEEDIIDMALKQIPTSPSAGSAWLVNIRGIPSLGRTIVYDVFLYSDSDGEIYYRLLISSNHYY